MMGGAFSLLSLPFRQWLACHDRWRVTSGPNVNRWLRWLRRPSHGRGQEWRWVGCQCFCFGRKVRFEFDAVFVVLGLLGPYLHHHGWVYYRFSSAPLISSRVGIVC
ncbi:hypothetical protein CDEST_08501 [Colletotrichum destructivum]|uniref:Secreted protein n=1 Tax=Colletotrichum destructivum TaxID=34406 RepID=A0AAX4IJA0_9PEZI|nr:hypothetical protein CDEST_08501 [Colletotrichum destructivum]